MTSKSSTPSEKAPMANGGQEQNSSQDGLTRNVSKVSRSGPDGHAKLHKKSRPISTATMDSMVKEKDDSPETSKRGTQDEGAEAPRADRDMV